MSRRGRRAWRSAVSSSSRDAGMRVNRATARPRSVIVIVSPVAACATQPRRFVQCPNADFAHVLQCSTLGGTLARALDVDDCGTIRPVVLRFDPRTAQAVDDIGPESTVDGVTELCSHGLSMLVNEVRHATAAQFGWLTPDPRAQPAGLTGPSCSRSERSISYF